QAWNGLASGLEVVGLSERMLHRIKQMAPETRPGQRITSISDPRWRHQDEALTRFLKVRHGILEMATGTGKTRTALKILAALVSRRLVDGAIVATVGTDLLGQWVT